MRAFEERPKVWCCGRFIEGQERLEEDLLCPDTVCLFELLDDQRERLFGVELCERSDKCMDVGRFFFAELFEEKPTQWNRNYKTVRWTAGENR